MGNKSNVEILILLIVGFGATVAFIAGIVLLVLYVRAGRDEAPHRASPVAYGNVVQCPRCAYMNPPDTAACLHCGLPFAPGPRRVTSAAGTVAPAQPGMPAPRSTASPRGAPDQRAAPAPARPSPGRPVDMPRAWIEGIGGAMKGQTARIEKPDTLVGRSNACDIQIFDPKVSRRHFMIRYGRGAFYLQDQHSSRGTRINGEQVMAQKLHDGDQITIGDTRLIFHVEP